MNWHKKKLDEVCDFSSGLWKGKQPPYQEVAVIRNTNFTKEGTLDDATIAYLDVEIKQYAKRKLTYGDIILEKSGGGPKQPVGRVVLFDKKAGEFSFSNFTSAIRVKKKDELDFQFLHKYLFAQYLAGVTEGMQSHSTGIRNLDLNAYKSIEIPLPPLAEQHRIVKILDDVFAAAAKAKENAEKNLQNARELFESYLNSTFTNPGEDWQSINLGGAVDIINGGTPKTNISKYWGNGHYWITPKDMGKLTSRYVGETERMITYQGLENSSAKLLPVNSVILSSRAPIGHLAINTIEMATNQGCKGLLPKKDILTIFLYYFLKHSVELLNELGSGTTFKEISGSKLSDIPIAFPSIDAQEAIVAKLDALSSETKKLEEIYAEKLRHLEELKKSILKKAFSGEL